MAVDLGSMRKAYQSPQNALKDFDYKNRCPFEIFNDWFEIAKQSSNSFNEVNGVCLSTASKEGRPSSRMVLLKSYSKDGFTIFTNYQSRKAREIEENPNVALLFYWDSMNRQIRIEGKASRVTPQESDDYFHRRPRSSQISARVSKQSRPIEDRETLAKKHQEEEEKFPDTIPCPDYWGGFRIVPERFEFWQGQSDRLHDRFQFDRQQNDTWNITRLQP